MRTLSPTEPWFSKAEAGAGLVMLTEPFVNPYMRANLWHLRGRDADLLVDTGMGIRPLAPEIETEPGKPLLVVATHIHLDHVGSLNEFDIRLGPAQSAAAFATMPDAATYAHEFRHLPEAVSALPHEGWSEADYAIRPAPLTRTLAEGDTVDLGDRRFTVLALPGHSPDSIALLDEKDGLFFAGDAIYDDTLLDDMPDSDPTVYCRTMRRLIDLPIRIGHGGHGPSFDRGRMRQIAEDYLRKSES